MADGNTVAGVAWRGHIRGIVEVQGRQFILFPKLPVGRVKIGRLIGFATEGRFTDIVVATNGAIPAVRGQFDRTCQPKVFQFTTSAGCDVFGTPQCLLVANVGSQLADAKKRHLTFERRRIDVVSRCRSRSRRPSRNAPIVAGGIDPVVRSCQIPSPGRVCEIIIVVPRIHQTGKEDLLDIVQIQRELRSILCAPQSGKNHTSQNRNDGNDNQQLNEGESQ